MAVRDALSAASIRLVGQRPSTFFGADGQTELELTDLVNEVAKDVAKYQDWQAITKIAEIVTNGGETYPFPSDYDRMTQAALMHDVESWAWGYFHYSDINRFIYDKDRGFQSIPGGWIIFGDEFHFSPIPTGTAKFPYITKNIVTSSGGVEKPEFTNDSDVFKLPERLLTLGLVWRWREQKKLDATGDMEAFTKALDEYAVKDGGSRVIRRRSRWNFWPGTHPAWPWQLGN